MAHFSCIEAYKLPLLCVVFNSARTFTTEILEGFDVQRTRDTSETVQKYGQLTTAIIDRYSLEVGKPGRHPGGYCMRYVEFVNFCKDVEMERVTDVFGVQLMQVNFVFFILMYFLLFQKLKVLHVNYFFIYVWAVQVRNVTEDMALSILERYPTLHSLALAYTELVSSLAKQPTHRSHVFVCMHVPKNLHSSFTLT